MTRIISPFVVCSLEPLSPSHLLFVLCPHGGVPQPLGQGVDVVVKPRRLDLVIGLSRINKESISGQWQQSFVYFSGWPVPDDDGLHLDLECGQSLLVRGIQLLPESGADLLQRPRLLELGRQLLLPHARQLKMK